MVNGGSGLFKKNGFISGITGTFERIAITIQGSTPLLPIGGIITLPMEFNLPSH